MYFEFNAKDLPDSHFAWHPNIYGGCWARKQDASRYAIPFFDEDGWHPRYAPTSIPLHCTGRIVKTIPKSPNPLTNYGRAVLEVKFDYGHMKGTRWGFTEDEMSVMSAIRKFTSNDEYKQLRKQCEAEYNKIEDCIAAKLQKEKNERLDFIRESIVKSHGMVETSGPTLILSTEARGLKLQAVRVEKLAIHGMGTFAENLVKGDVKATPDARSFLSGRSKRGVQGLEVWENVMGWFGISSHIIVKKDEISVNQTPAFL
jgi:hypothetical protein